MDIIDKHFISLSPGKQIFVVIVGLMYFCAALIAFFLKALSAGEAVLLAIIGVLFSEMIKLHYRIESLEKKKKKR